MRRAIFWFAVLHKRLLKKISFVIILLLIPLLTGLMSLSARQESGFIRVALYSPQPNDPLVQSVVTQLTEGSDIVTYQCVSDTKEGIRLLKAGEVDAVWALEEDLTAKLHQMAQDKTQVKLAHIYAVESNTYISTATEQLYGALYEQLSHELYGQYIAELEDITPEQAKASYDAHAAQTQLVTFEYLDSDGGEQVEQVNYLTTPLRGLLAVLMLLCGLAATMYFRADEREGVFDSLTVFRRFAVCFGNNVAALGLSGVVVSFALLLSGNYTDFGRETLMMIFFILICAAFCTLFGTVFMSLHSVSLLLPVVLVLAISLSPIFFNVQKFGLVRILLPTHYYLYGLNDVTVLWQMVVYFVCALTAAALLYRLRFAKR